MLIIMILSLIRTDGIKTPPMLAFEGADKVIHVLMYAGLTLVYLIEHSHLLSRERDYQRVKIYSITWIMAMGGLLELAQPIFGGRHKDWRDFLANCTGVILVYLTYRFVLKLILKKQAW
jgi:VanZ family protein